MDPKKEYESKRAEMMAQAQAFIDEGKTDDANGMMENVKKLDSDYEAATSARALHQMLNRGDALPDLANRSVKDISGGKVIARTGGVPDEPEDITNSMDYRRAFMNRVATGAAMPSTYSNANESTTTGDVATTIPTVLVNKIIEKMETIGMILPLITKVSQKAGITIPVSGVKPVASWVAEGKGSDRQKTSTDKISFTYHKLRCEISVSMEVDTLSISAFEAMFVRQVSEAMVKAIETAIISDGAGTDRPRGILFETPESGQALTADKLDYKLLIDAEAAVPQAYEGGARYFMSKKTFMSYMGMTDDNGQPIARINYGIGGTPERMLMGRSVVLTGDYLPSFSEELEAGKVFAFLFNPSDYVMNTIYNMGIQRKQDWDTEDWLTKAVMSVDGKVVDKGSLVTLAKK